MTNGRWRLSAADRLHHLYVLGPTGSGKTTLLANLIADDIAEGHGVAVIDGKGGTADGLVAKVVEGMPRARLADVVLYDVADVDRPVGFNILAGDNPYRTTATWWRCWIACSICLATRRGRWTRCARPS